MYEIYKKLRDAKGVSDYEVSKQTGIAKSTLWNWGKENYTPKIDKIAKIADYFGVPIETFIQK